ncbi:uncharacterized protein LOC110765438 isoform X2 [Prunus avium]|uniref:Uncharacterized protein LOC110765438 isoform X2 n=1 Tax=Prunus avium TaxID=42229 RepID=A0A6P5TAJ5_PRUAV|nr:uncharacterized protein LOC110765438 isoform X2 [Prunus avium]
MSPHKVDIYMLLLKNFTKFSLHFCVVLPHIVFQYLLEDVALEPKRLNKIPVGGFSGNASSAPESRNCKFSSNVLIHAVDKLGSFLRKFPLFPNAFLLQKLKVEPAHKTSPGPESLGIIVGIVFLVLGILFQYFNFTADSNS